jgi:hypothetical protein
LHLPRFWFTLLVMGMNCSGRWLRLLCGCACLLTLAPWRLPGETLTYREVEGQAVATHVLSIAPEGSGFLVTLLTTRASGDVRQTFHTDAGLATLAWTFSDPGRRMELAASVQGKAIVLSGNCQGRPVEKEFAAAGPPWNQLFQIGLGPFVLSREKSGRFRSIGTEGPGETKLGKFTVTREDDETIGLGGKEIAAVHLSLSLSGLLSIFWHGDYWFRRGDGRFLRYRGKNRPGGAVAESDLVEERIDDAPR